MKSGEIKIHEVGLRDGLQVEARVVPLEEKIRWAESLVDTGIDIIQLGSFVHPVKVPQMADTDKLFEYFNSHKQSQRKVVFSGLVLNERGLERGLACGVEMFCMGVSASETHSKKNTGITSSEALKRIVAMGKTALAEGTQAQLSVQSAFGCGFEGAIPQENVLRIVREYVSAGFKNISLADTAGHANPQQVEELFGALLDIDSELELTCHFHNTYGLGLANCYAALKSGVTSFESSFGGLGGCPFTKVAAGNVSTEDLVHSLQRMGHRSDIQLERLIVVAKEVGAFFNRELPGSILKVGSIVGFNGG